MGIVDRVRGLFGSGSAEDDVAAAAESVEMSEHTASLDKRTALRVIKLAMEQGKLPPNTLGVDLGELGISGTPNYRGDVYSESNVKLIHEQAFGSPGARTWGQWQQILMTDPAVHVGNEMLKAAIRDCEVSIDPPDEELVPKAIGQQMADALKCNLFEQLSPGWPSLISSLVESTVYGFSLHEKVWARTEANRFLPGKSGFILQKLEERLPVSIHPYGWREKNGELDRVIQWGMRDDSDDWQWVQELALPAKRLLLMSWNRRGKNFLGHSAWRAVWYPCQIRRELLKVTGIGLVRESLGVPYAYTDNKNVKMSSSQRKAIQTFLENNVYHENAAVALPSGWKMEWFHSPGANKGHVVEAFNSLGSIILAQVGLQWMQLGVHSQTGSRSVGETQKTASDDFVKGLASEIEAVLNGRGLTSRPYEGIARDFVIANWGQQPAYPTIKLTLKKAQLDPGPWATGIVALKGAGLVKVWRREDENEARERFSLDPVTQEDWDAAKQEALDQQQAMLGQQQLGPDGKPLPPRPGDPKLPPGKPAQKALPPGKGDKPVAASAGGFFPRRALRPSEQHLALAEMADFLDTSKESFERGAKPIVVAMLHQARPALRAAASDGRIDHAEVAALKFDTTELEAFIGSYLERARREGYRQVANERAKQVGVALAGGDDEPDPSEEWARLEEAQKKSLAKRIADRLRFSLETEAIGSERRAADIEKMLDEVVTQQVDSKALQADAGLVVTTAFNMGREQFADEYGDEIESVEASEVLDDNTCDPCEAADGTEYEFGSDEYELNTPPRHDCDGGKRCRGIYIYTFKKPGDVPAEE